MGLQEFISVYARPYAYPGRAAALAGVEAVLFRFGEGDNVRDRIFPASACRVRTPDM